MFSHLTHVLSTLASTEETIRTSMKDLRTRGEALEGIRRRQRALTTQATHTERRLSKMTPHHINFAAQEAALSELRKDIRYLNEEIAEGEINCSKLKKTSAQQWMAKRFGGIYSLAECSQVRLSSLVVLTPLTKEFRRSHSKASVSSVLLATSGPRCKRRIPMRATLQT
jgi:hypothetical protein